MRVEMLNHQMTMDFLNESVQQETKVDPNSPVESMEQLKQINVDWIQIKSLTAARIDVSVR